ncbi:mannose-6-phosphate isomerase-like protein (cupin superfamily) [Paenibacillus phyllosphaerae]|uniref:Mannose-6-phosphate isomerase-like protein (Cupin superfamily) n=1 Tax=Paenibacillus phyllosphaerae TaxID=274593 RepID=A0A7W5B0S9_9BACL|nr:cupin domain-containing protein [Paenibacillus phyllosphaerae]MBB3111811.1 mannose-6-phosphate isomerase-like protein (cupin superfamily) [Paenibacillus phyllosphaerae]
MYGYPRAQAFPMYVYPAYAYPSNAYPYYAYANMRAYRPGYVTGYYPAYMPHPGSLPAIPRSDVAEAMEIKDYGPNPTVVNIEQMTTRNDTFRTALWTGKHFQVTVMSIPVGEDIGLEVHPATDQFIRIEQGQGLVQMGDAQDQLDFQKMAHENETIMVPAGTWHNVTNTGDRPLKVYVIYAPPEHPHGTVHATKAEATAMEKHQP